MKETQKKLIGEAYLICLAVILMSATLLGMTTVSAGAGQSAFAETQSDGYTQFSNTALSETASETTDVNDYYGLSFNDNVSLICELAKEQVDSEKHSAIDSAASSVVSAANSILNGATDINLNLIISDFVSELELLGVNTESGEFAALIVGLQSKIKTIECGELATQAPYSVVITNAPSQLLYKESVIIIADVAPNMPEGYAVKWSSSRGEVASIDVSTGEMVALNQGAVVVTATLVDQNGHEVVVSGNAVAANVTVQCTATTSLRIRAFVNSAIQFFKMLFQQFSFPIIKN